MLTRKQAEIERMNKLEDELPPPTVNWYACFGDDSAFGCDYCEWHGLCAEIHWKERLYHADFIGVVVIVEESG